MSCWAEYALVDVGNGRATEGQILVLVDSELTAEDMAAELRRRGCRVVIKAMGLPRGLSEADDGEDRLAVRTTG